MAAFDTMETRMPAIEHRPGLSDPRHAASFDPAVFACLVRQYRSQPASDLAQRWVLLEAAHVVGQVSLVPM